MMPQQPISGSGVIRFRGTGVINQSAYVGKRRRSTFSGPVIVESGGLTSPAELRRWTDCCRKRDRLWLETNATYDSPMAIAGLGWTETAGQLGAVAIGRTRHRERRDQTDR